MKKITVLIISCIFIVSNNIQASPFAPNFNPYSFGPQGRTMADLRDFAKPKQMANILAGRPVVATKADGSRVYYTTDGKLCLSIKQNGEMNFSLGGHSINLDKNGNLKSETKTFKGNFQEVRDEFGDITGYNQLDGSGKVIASFDEDMNKTIIYNYGKFGKSIEYSVNLMNGQKTVYDEHERAMAVYDINGYILTSYQYEDISFESAEDRKTLLININGDKKNRRLLTTKSYSHDINSINEEDGSLNILMAHTTTYYDGNGLTSYVKDANNITSTVYHYNKDTSGNTVLQYVLDVKTKERTYYENNKQMYVLNEMGIKIREFYWNGSKYLFSANYVKDENGNYVWESTTNDKGLKTTGNIVYNKDGQINTILSEEGKIIKRYFYKNIDGREVLDYIENVLDNTTTYFDEDGCSTKTVDAKGNIIVDYGWNEGKLIYSFDRASGITSWYMHDKVGEPIEVYKSLNDRIQSQNIYSGGQLIAQWTVVHGSDLEEGEDGTEEVKNKTYKLVIFVNERQEFELEVHKEPTVDQVRYLMNRYMNTGIMTTDNVYDENNNKVCDWECIKRTNDEQKGVASFFYRLKIYTDDGDSFVVDYESISDDENSLGKDKPTYALIEEILDYKSRTGNAPTEEYIKNYFEQLSSYSNN